MNKLIICIKDELKGYQNVTLADTEDLAIRDFTYAIRNTAMMSQNVKDFSLWKVGDFDTEKGLVLNAEPHLIIDASSVLRKGE